MEEFSQNESNHPWLLKTKTKKYYGCIPKFLTSASIQFKLSIVVPVNNQISIVNSHCLESL